MSERAWHLFGWALFLVSACLYIADSWRAGDILGFIGSIFFLLACFAFVLPLLRRKG